MCIRDSLQTVPARNVFGDGEPIDVVNVIAWIPGTANTKAVLFVGHYDTFPTTPGGNDATSAVATMLETARALQAGPPLANDVLFLFTDGEEPSDRFGANGFASIPGIIDRLGLVVNLEATGGKGASTLVETGGPRSWLVGNYAAAAPRPTAFSFLTDLSRMLGDIGTDFDVFRNAGLPGMHFVYLRCAPIYHTMADDAASVGAASLRHHGTNSLAIARRFGDLDLAAAPDSGDAVFFTLRPLFVRYGVVWGVVAAALATALLAWALARGPIPIGPSARAAGASLLGSLAGAVVGTVLWLIITAMRSSPGVEEAYAYLAALLALCAAATRWVTGRLDGTLETAIRSHGRVALWVVLALITVSYTHLRAHET